MEGLEHSLLIVELFNKAFGPPLAALLRPLGVRVADPAHFAPDFVVMSLIVVVLLSLTLGLASRKLALVPGRRQAALEAVVGFFEGQVDDLIGPKGRAFLPVIGTVGLFVLTANLIGLVPGFMSPTSKLNVTLGCGLVVFFYYHAMGVKVQGLRYFKQFLGPIPAIAPLMLPIEIISHFSRPLSLGMRLFGNIFSEELLILIMASIIPYFLPLPFMILSLFTSVIQSFVFILLSCIYISGAISAEEH